MVRSCILLTHRTMSPEQQKLAVYARRVFSGASLSSLESVGTPGGARFEAAVGGLEAAMNDYEMSQVQFAALEAVIHKEGRPALLIKQDSFDDPPEQWAKLIGERNALKPVIQAIGRVEVMKISGPFGGTGFFVAPNVILTNRHVAELFTYGLGNAPKLKFIPGREPSFDTAKEVPQPPSPIGAAPAGMTFRVKKPLMIHPHWDAALLEVVPDEQNPVLPQVLTLAGTEPAEGNWQDRDVVVIGYPYFSPGHEAQVMKNIFDGIYGVKRLQPGKLVERRQIRSYGHIVESITHDASTLGGNSGSAVIDFETKQVLALHFAGAYLEANYAVPLWELARDPRVVDLGLNFSPSPPNDQPRTSDAGGPIWLDSWQGREAAANAASATVQEAAPKPISESRARLFDPTWFERYSDEEMARLYQRDPEAMRELIAASFTAKEQEELIDTLLWSASTESIREATTDPDLPEIVLLPGIMGSHLNAGWRPRAWLNFLTMPFTDLLSSLGLDGNGNDPNGLSPDGIVRSFYSSAARRWRNQGYRVHEFGYDWRKPLAHAATALDRFLRNRRRERPAAQFVLVAHSMGTLVSSVYSMQTPDWRDYVTKAVFCGGPLGGSFAIPYMLAGEWPSLKKIAAVSASSSLEELRTMGSTFPGAIEMMPNPDLFTVPGADVEELYQPRLYASFARPSSDWLAASRSLKRRLREAPILARTTILVNIDLPTPCTFIKKDGIAMPSPLAMRGDGTVPARSALVPGVTAYRVFESHGDLLRDEGVIDAVPRLIHGEEPPLAEVTNEDVAAPLPEAASTMLETFPVLLEGRAAAIRERMNNGIVTTEDVRWILR